MRELPISPFLMFLGLGLGLIGIDRRIGRNNAQAAGVAT
jgi:hypothetical protein